MHLPAGSLSARTSWHPSEPSTCSIKAGSLALVTIAHSCMQRSRWMNICQDIQIYLSRHDPRSEQGEGKELTVVLPVNICGKVSRRASTIARLSTRLTRRSSGMGRKVSSMSATTYGCRN